MFSFIVLGGKRAVLSSPLALMHPCLADRELGGEAWLAGREMRRPAQAPLEGPSCSPRTRDRTARAGKGRGRNVSPGRLLLEVVVGQKCATLKGNVRTRLWGPPGSGKWLPEGWPGARSSPDV